MGKHKKSLKERKQVKATVKYLAYAPNDRIGRAVLAASPPGVVRAIANAALNARENPSVVLSPGTKELFRTYSRSFDLLSRPDVPLEQKRKHLIQKGGAFPILIPLLTSVLGSLGSAVISRVFNRNSEQ